MADWANPTTGSTYANYTTELKALAASLAKGMDSALVSDTNVLTNTVRWNSSNSNWERWNGASWAVLTATYGISISGNAATATTAAACSGNAATATTAGACSGNAATATTATTAGTCSGNAATASAVAWSGVTSKPTTIAGYGITDSIAPKEVLQNSQSANYTCVLGDSGKSIFHPAADTTARVWTIPSNASVPYPIGTVLTFDNEHGAGVITIAITTDTMRLAGPGTTGSRTLAADGIATAIKNTATSWKISGTGLT